MNPTLVNGKSSISSEGSMALFCGTIARNCCVTCGLGDYEGYVVGLVVSCEPVPNKDNLLVLKVDVGSGTDLQIVTNAPNVSEGKRVVVANVGSKDCVKDYLRTLLEIPSRPIYLMPVVSQQVRMNGDETEVKKVAVGGVPSEGMLCDSPMLGWVGGGAGNAALVPDTFAVGSCPPPKRPRMVHSPPLHIRCSHHTSLAWCHSLLFVYINPTQLG
eukprot:6523585-Pyramimonas_sp.AAC.2